MGRVLRAAFGLGHAGDGTMETMHRGGGGVRDGTAVRGRRVGPDMAMDDDVLRAAYWVVSVLRETE